MRIISCYSRDTPYEQEADRLRASLDRLDLPHIIVPRPDRGSWLGNLREKAAFMHEARAEHNGPLLWVDADAVVHRDVRPDMDGWTEDVGFAYHKGVELLTGTVWMNDTPRCRALMLRMLDVIDDRGGTDAHAMERAVMMIDGLTIHRMSNRYCYIFDLTSIYHPGEPVVIEHLQASRDYRRPDKPMNTLRQRRHDKLAEMESGR